MNSTPAHSLFDEAYESRTAPWVIGEPQPAIVELERTGRLGGKVLDAGCGAGEHTMLLTRLGYDVLGIDFSEHAVAQARQTAAERGIDARFAVADATRLGESPGPRYDTIVDSALFHVSTMPTGRAMSPASTERAIPARGCTYWHCRMRAVASGPRSARTSSVRPSPMAGIWNIWRPRPTAVWWVRRMPRRSANRSAPGSTSRRGWLESAGSEALTVRRSPDVLRRAGGAPGPGGSR